MVYGVVAIAVLVSLVAWLHVHPFLAPMAAALGVVVPAREPHALTTAILDLAFALQYRGQGCRAAGPT